MSQVEYAKTKLSYQNFWVHFVISNQLASMNTSSYNILQQPQNLFHWKF